MQAENICCCEAKKKNSWLFRRTNKNKWNIWMRGVVMCLFTRFFASLCHAHDTPYDSRARVKIKIWFVYVILRAWEIMRSTRVCVVLIYPSKYLNEIPEEAAQCTIVHHGLDAYPPSFRYAINSAFSRRITLAYQFIVRAICSTKVTSGKWNGVK